MDVVVVILATREVICMDKKEENLANEIMRSFLNLEQSIWWHLQR
jgi:hypothetical protein